jgi:ankyrin repeat protein
VSVDEVNSNKQSALHVAALYGRTNAAKYLLKSGADINLQDKKGRSPVMVATQLGHYETVTYFRKEKAILEMPNGRARSAIHFAVLGNLPAMVEHILAAGLSVERRDGNGQTPLALAARYSTL